MSHLQNTVYIYCFSYFALWYTFASNCSPTGVSLWRTMASPIWCLCLVSSTVRGLDSIILYETIARNLYLNDWLFLLQCTMTVGKVVTHIYSDYIYIVEWVNLVDEWGNWWQFLVLLALALLTWKTVGTWSCWFKADKMKEILISISFILYSSATIWFILCSNVFLQVITHVVHVCKCPTPTHTRPSDPCSSGCLQQQYR